MNFITKNFMVTGAFLRIGKSKTNRMMMGKSEFFKIISQILILCQLYGYLISGPYRFNEIIHYNYLLSKQAIITHILIFQYVVFSNGTQDAISICSLIVGKFRVINEIITSIAEM